MTRIVRSIPLAAIRAARNRIAGAAIRTPLLRLDLSDAPAEVYLKLENLQPIGSFKVRGASNAMGLASPEQLGRGVYTASAGNMAQGVAWNARRLDVPCRVIVPEGAPRIKVEAAHRLGAEVLEVPFDEWWQILEDHDHPGSAPGFFIHPVSDPAVIAGNGTIALEILEDLPDPDVVLVPWGGGGLATGIASGLRQLRPETRVYGVEVETAAPLAASLSAGAMTSVERKASFVDGIGSGGLLPKMWPFARELLTGALTASVSDVANALRLVVERNRVVAEGAGACSVAVALSERVAAEKIVCIVSGGNIDTETLVSVLSGDFPDSGR
jgi:threonine dehydratase